MAPAQSRRCPTRRLSARSRAVGRRWSANRARLSLFPSTASTSKIPGEVVRPVSAARSGCATLPSLTPRSLGKAAHGLLGRLRRSRARPRRDHRRVSPSSARASRLSSAGALSSGPAGGRRAESAPRRAARPASSRVPSAPAWPRAAWRRSSGVSLRRELGPPSRCAAACARSPPGGRRPATGRM